MTPTNLELVVREAFEVVTSMVVVGERELARGLGEVVASTVDGEFCDVCELASDSVETVLLKTSV